MLARKIPRFPPASASLADVAPTSFNVQTAPAVTIAEGANVEIAGISAQSVTFTGTTGTLKLDHSLAFTGEVAGLAGSDSIDLADVNYGVQFCLKGGPQGRGSHQCRARSGQHRLASDKTLFERDVVPSHWSFLCLSNS